MAATQFNPAYLTDPALYGDQQAIEQQRQLADLLMKQGVTPLGGTESVGGVAIRRSPLEGAAKLAQLLSGQQMYRDTNTASQALMQRQAQAMMGMFGGQPQSGGMGTAEASPGAVPAAPNGGIAGGQGPALGAAMGGQAAPATPAGSLGLPGMSPMQSMLGYSMNPDKYMESFLKGYTPNDTTIQARQAGVDPQVANRLALIKSSTDPKILAMQQAGLGPMQIYQAIYGEASKNAEVSRRPGEGYSNALTGEAGMVGKIPEGANVTGAPGPNGQVSLSPMPGNAGVLAANSAATGAGTSTNDMMSVELPNGQKQNMTRAQAVQYANGGQGDGYNFQIKPGTEAEMRSQIQQSGDFGALGAFDKQAGAARMPGFQSGQSTASAAGATKAGALPQETLETRFTQLRDANGQAETTNSYLQNIKDLSGKASTGQFADKIQYVNSLLAPFSERATDAATANNLLDKYSNQIVARLGQGGLGTDAARSILQSAYPNSHMTQAAINDAADNLMGANKMIQAKTRMLSPLATARDAAGYQQAEQAFDQAADPRIFQIANMPAAQAQKYIASLTPEVQADLRKRAAMLKQMGAF